MCVTVNDYPNFLKSDLCVVHFQAKSSNWKTALDSIDSSSIYSVIDGISGWGNKKIEKTIKSLRSSCKVTNQAEFYELCKIIITAEDSSKQKEVELAKIFSTQYLSDNDKLTASVTFLDGFSVYSIYFEYDGTEIDVYTIDNKKFAANSNRPPLYSVALQSNIDEYYKEYADSTSACFTIKVL